MRALKLFIIMIFLFTLGLSLSACVNTGEFTIYFDSNGGTEVSPVTTGGLATISIPDNPTRDGYTFSGWYRDDITFEIPFNANSLMDVPLSSGMTVYAKWDLITCEFYEELQDNVCVIVDADAKLIFDVFNNLDTFNDYTLEIIVQNQMELYYMTIEFDDTKSSFEIDGNKEYYMFNNGVNEHYFKQGDSYQKETSTEPLSDNYLFFYHLDAEMFTFVEGKYYLNIQNNSDIEAFFEAEFPECMVQNFELTIENEQISEFVFDLIVGQINYRMVMNFSLIGETSITIPAV